VLRSVETQYTPALAGTLLRVEFQHASIGLAVLVPSKAVMQLSSDGLLHRWRTGSRCGEVVYKGT
jgi:hypothetical protein